MKKHLPNLHDVETLAAVFVGGMAYYMSLTNGSFTKDTIHSAVIAGFSAVLHKYATTKE